MVLLVVGVLLGGYSLLFFDTSVVTPMGHRVNNLGLMQDRQNLLIAGGVMAVIGAVLTALGRSRPLQDDEQFEKALSRADLGHMALLLDSGKVSPDGLAPNSKSGWLRLTMVSGGLPQAKLLLEKGADPAKPDGFGSSPLETLKRNPRSFGAAGPQFVALFEEHLEKPRQGSESAARDSDLPALPPSSNVLEQLKELATLREHGTLSDEEFALAKARVLRPDS
jgi:hypothetical protein